MHHFFIRYVFLIFLGFSAASAGNKKWTDQQVRQQIVKESISNYYGNCPCPYNTARNGSQCGKRSAWSRAGGASPLCYEHEVPPEMVANWRAQNTSPPPDSATR